MNLIIHRGTNEIGGTCIELQSGNNRILLDFGMPLVDSKRNSFNFNKYQKFTPQELVDKGVLPNIRGLYTGGSKIDAIIISHPHADHFGLINYLDPEIPVYLGHATHKILDLNNIFLQQNFHIKHPHHFEKEVPFSIGNYTITPYWNDHSAFDTYSFLIEADKTRLFYTGDFRSHGRRHKVYKWFLNNAPERIDYLLLEGTQIGRNPFKLKTEDEIELEFAKIFKDSSSINYVITSSQNIDRLVSIYKACLSTGKIFVVDVYTANVLEALSDYANLPSLLKEYSNLQVLFPHKLTTGLFDRGYGDLAKKFAKPKLKSNKELISANPSKYVVIVRPSMEPDLNKIIVENGNIIYSIWEGYKNQPYTRAFIDRLLLKNFKEIPLHTSGHADVDTLIELADTIKPTAIIPIHTFNKYDYRKIFTQNIIELNDNQTFTLTSLTNN